VNPLLLLEMAASGFGERVAVQNGSDRLTYAELFAAAAAARELIEESGAEHVGVLDLNSLAVPVGLFAAAWAGRPFVPLNYRLSAGELDALVTRITPSLLIAEPGRVAQLAGRAETRVIARDEFLARAARGVGALPEWPNDPAAIAVLLFTSGTTGAPKAAVLRNRHLVSYILGSVEFAAAGEDEAALVSVPPYHVAAMAAILSSIYAGRRIVQLPSFAPDLWVETARAEHATHAFVVPTMLSRIVEALEREGTRLPSLRALSYGGGKMPLPVIERAMRVFPGVDFTNAYGLTETSSTIALLGPDDHRAAAASEAPALRRRLASVGRPLPGVEVEVRDEDGKAVPCGTPGEIHVRGEQVSGEYLGRASTLGSDGWFPTRDGGFVDEEGYLFVTGRIDDVIVRGGENLSPGEIEEVLHEHPAVADCAVVGVPDEQWGEAVAAVIVPREGPGAVVDAEALREWVRARLRSSRVPQRIEFRDALPYNETGKLLRRKVRAELAGTP
jgi:acyl-CoA synthetase (AMP-forming)/AMP-acid ligase II